MLRSRLAMLPLLLLAVTLGCDSGDSGTASDRASPRAEPSVVPDRAGTGHAWNTAQIHWEDLDTGLARARRDHKPVLLVVYADWCPHCKSYSLAFGDPRVVALADQYVMIRVNQDQNDAVGARYSPDGSYIPRTLFLTPDGRLRGEMTGNNPRYRYFLDERGTALVDLMKQGVGT